MRTDKGNIRPLYDGDGPIGDRTVTPSLPVWLLGTGTHIGKTGRDWRAITPVRPT